MKFETIALIVGGGPVGLAASIELSWRSVPAMLVTEKPDTAQHPKCNNTNARSMEHFRRLGIAGEIRAAQLPSDLPRASAYVTRFCGHEYGRQDRPYSNWPTPELPCNISQMALEKVLRRAAERHNGTNIHFGWRLQGFTQSDDGVLAAVTDTASGETHHISARYLLGIDGAGSTVRRALGVNMIGQDGSEQRAFMGGTMLSWYIRAPTLIAASKRIPTHMTWIINADMRAMMYSQDGRETWVVHYQVPADTDWREVDVPATLRALFGAEVPVELISGGPWTGGLALVAEHYQSGPVFLAGDAAHLFTPLGGLGMNTGIGDVMNLGWKLAAVHQGWGGGRLLTSYETERHPIGTRNTQLGVRCTQVMDRWTPPPDAEEDTAAAEAGRKAFGMRIMAEDRPQYLTVGIQLGERYETSPVIWHDATASPPDRWDVYTPSDRPGGRAPHFMATPDRVAFDAFGAGFTLLDFGAADGAQAFTAAAARRNMPLKVLRCERPDRLYEKTLVLIRPDHHIAWHGDRVDDALAVIDRVRGA